MQSKTITYQSSSIHYRVSGGGQPVVLLHGFGEDGEIWDKQVEFLKTRFRVIVPDLPGSGQSEVISRESGAWIEVYAEIVKAILVEEKTTQCVMIGHSMGGYITLAFAEKYPEWLQAFGLFHSTAYADSEEKKLNRLKSIEFINNNGAYAFLKTSIPALFWKQDNTYIARLIEKGKDFSSGALAQYYAAMIARPNRTEVLKHFPRPILFVLGQYDPAVPFRDGLQQSYLPTQSYIHVLRKTAHMGMLEETEKANEILLQFLLSLPSAV